MASILLKDPALWDTVPSGLLASGDTLGHDSLVASDLFDDASLDPALWDTDIVDGGGSSSIVEAAGVVNLKTTTAGGGAILVYKVSLDRTERWRCRFKVYPKQNGVSLGLQDALGFPDCATVVAWHAKSIMEIAPSSADDLYWSYWDLGAIQQLWQSNLGWTTGTSPRAAKDILNAWLIYEVESDGTNLIMRLINPEGEGMVFTSVPWSGVRAAADDMYLIIGDPFLGTWTTEMDITEFYHYGPYQTGLVAAMGQRNVGQVIENIPITESAEAGASIAWRYDKDGAGFVMPGGGTLAELKAALVGEFVNTLDLEATFTSDGVAQASFDINGGVIAGYGATFNLPLEIIERHGLEVVEV